MAEFLTTSDVTAHLEKIIKEAKSRLVLISPYLQINPKIKTLLQDKDREIQTKVESRLSKMISALKNEDATAKMKIHIVYRNDKLHADESTWLQSLSSIEIIPLRNLHAKCYLNEDYALITSMNLYQFSQVHNYEMGILVARKNWDNSRDNELYQAIEKHAEELIRYGKEEDSVVNPVIPSTETPTHSEAVPATPRPPKQSPSLKRKTTTPTLERPYRAQCIRCDDPIATESQPFCDTDWGTWDQHKKDSWPGKVCLFCEAPKTYDRQPLCLKCYNEHKSILTKYKSILGL